MATVNVTANAYLADITYTDGDTFVLSAGVTLYFHKSFTALLTVGAGATMEPLNGNATVTVLSGSTFNGSFKLAGGPLSVENNTQAGSRNLRGIGGLGV